MLKTHPERVIESSVKGMLPRGPLGRKMLGKLRVYKGPEHDHSAQQPIPLEVNV
jgi:large subunit ribosomal protein L13